MYCSKCGTKNNDEANFCWNCGAPLAKKEIGSYTQAVELALEGDEKGFSYLYEETYKSKYYLALKYMDDKDAAEDVLQDAYIKAFSKLASLKEPETFPAWLGTIVANTAKNALQKKNPVLFTDLPSGEEDTDLPDFDVEDESVESQPEAAYTKQETEEMVHELIDSLSEEQKMCILMYYIDGESVRDIAEALDCSESAVKSRLSYGRKNLKAKAEAMQKKGYKLFTLAPITLLLALVHNDAEAAVCEKEFIAAGRRVAEEVLQKASQIAKTAAASQAGGTGAAAHQAGTGMAAKAAAGAGAAGKGGAGAGAVAGFISSTGGKVVIFVVAVAVVTGAVVGGMHSRYVRRSEEVVVYEDGSVAEEPGQNGSDDTGTTPSPFDDVSGSEADAAEDASEANAPSVMSVQGLLDLFPYMADNLLYEYYWSNETVVNFLNSGITSANQVYCLAALAAVEPSEYYKYVDENDYIEMKSYDGISYIFLPTELYADTLRNMFGEGYDISDFIETPGCVLRDGDGTFYAVAGDYGAELVEVSVENISDTPDEDGTYSALAKYSESDLDNGNALGEYYMLYRLKPDESSDYGCVIVDMAPAGEGEVDESALANDSNGESSFVNDSNDLDAMYEDYYQKVLDYQNMYGTNSITSTENGITYIDGLAYVKLFDFNRDGQDELILEYNDPTNINKSIYSSIYSVFEIWSHVDNEMKLVYSGESDGRIEVLVKEVEDTYIMPRYENGTNETGGPVLDEIQMVFDGSQFVDWRRLSQELDSTSNEFFYKIDGQTVSYDQWNDALGDNIIYYSPDESDEQNIISENEETIEFLKDASS